MAALRSMFMRPFDVVIGTIPQPFGPFANYVRSRVGNASFVLDVRDLWPEGLTATGQVTETSLSYRIISAATRFLYKKADQIITVTDGIRDAILEKHQLNPKKFHVVRAAVDLDYFQNPSVPITSTVKAHIQGKFVVSYIGTIGNAHRLKTVVEAAQQLEKSHPERFAFVIAGSGAEESAIRKMVVSRQLRSVLCTGLVERDQIPGLLRASDLGIVSLRQSPVFETVVPTKIYEYMAAGLPILSNVAGEAADILARSGAGITVSGGSASPMTSGIIDLANNTPKLGEMAVSGKRFVEEHVSWDVSAAAYLEILERTITE